MTDSAQGYPHTYLVQSRAAPAFQHMGEVYIYHDLYGYILKMSPDILAFLSEFAEPVDPSTVCERYAEAFDDQAPETFVSIFRQYGCLVSAGADEIAPIFDQVGVHSKWKVYERTADGGLTFYTAWGDRPLTRHTLTADEVAIWDRFDGETELSEIAADHGQEAVAALVKRLVHHDLQALKLSHLKMSMFKNRQHMMPPYLTSTMPYAAYAPGKDPLPQPLEDAFSPENYYEAGIADADQQFDHQETTLSHLLRKPHPALRGRTYGQALVEALAERELLPTTGAIRVLEIGGGLGFVAEAVTRELQARGLDVDYQILELSPTLAAAQRERCTGLPVTVTLGNAMTAEFPGGPADLIVANEMIGDLPAVKLTHTQLGLDKEELAGETLQAHIAQLGRVGELINRYTLPLGDAPDPCYLNVGAMELLERVFGALAEGGSAVLTEFGHMGRYPVLSTQLDHPELSIHFGHLTLVAKAIGFEADFAFVMDLLGLERELEGLATTRSYFRALAGLMAGHGVTLEKIGYTREMFGALVGDALAADSYGDIAFERIEDRLMGLVPHEFKALILKRPPAE